MNERAAAAQDGADKAAHQRAVAVGECFQRGVCARTFELVVERPARAQYAVEDGGCDTARGEAGNLGGACKSRRRHEAAIIP